MCVIVIYCNTLLKVSYLCIVGGKTEDDTIKNVMAEVIGPKLTKTFNWFGKKSKQSFKALEIAKVVFGKTLKAVVCSWLLMTA